MSYGTFNYLLGLGMAALFALYGFLVIESFVFFLSLTSKKEKRQRSGRRLIWH